MKRLNDNVKGIMLFVGCVIAIIGCVKLLQLQDANEYKNAIKRCGEDNVTTRYTNDGDKYYTCTIEK